MYETTPSDFSDKGLAMVSSRWIFTLLLNETTGRESMRVLTSQTRITLM